MKKTLIAIACFGVLLATASGLAPASKKALTLGDEAPAVVLNNHTSSLTLDDLRGQWVILTFWSSADGASRAACNEYTSMARATDNLKTIGINMDENAELFRQTVRLDSLDESMQFNVTGTEAQLISQAYDKAADSYGALLIAPDGTIVAANPSAATVSEMMSKI